MNASAVVDLLVACRRGEALRYHLGEAPSARWRAITEAAILQGVPGVLLERLARARLVDALPTNCQMTLTAAARAVAMRNLRRLAALGELLRAFGEASIPVIVLKGAYLARHVYDDLSMRQMLDVDLLVRPADLTAAVGALRRLGFSSDQPVLPGERETGKHLKPMRHAGVGSVELHWNLTPSGRPYSIDPDELWDRVVPVTFSGMPAFGLSREDLILHVAFHATFDHQFGQGVKPLIDLAEITRWGGTLIDWQTIASRGQRWGWSRGVYLAVLLARDLAGAEVPESFLETTAPEEPADAERSMAIEQMMTSGYRTPVRRTVTALRDRPRLIDRLTYAAARLLPPPAAKAREFGVSTMSWRLPILYVSDIGRRLRRHAPLLAAWQTGRDPALDVYADNQNRLYHWVTDGAASTQSKPSARAPSRNTTTSASQVDGSTS